MIDTVRLYKLAPWQAMRFHYVRNGTQTTIENYFYKEYLGVRHPDELDFNITLPDIDDPDAVNIAKVGNKWYEVVDNIDTTRNEMSVTFVLRFDPFLTYWKSNNEATKSGIWEKLPYADIRARTQTVLDDSNLIESRTDKLNTMKCWNGTGLDDAKEYDMVWVEITTSCKLYGQIVYDSVEDEDYILSVDTRNYIEKSVDKQSELFKYGTFALYDKGKQVLRIAAERIFLDNGIDHFTIWYRPDPDHESTRDQPLLGNRLWYPSINDVMNNPDEVLGIPTDAIVDISVSAWCPYNWGRYHFEGIMDIPYLKSDSDVMMTPYIVRWADLPDFETEYGRAPSTAGFVAFYDLGRVGGSLIARDSWDTHTLELTEDEYVCGELYLRDGNGNMIAKIPRDYVKPTYNSQTQEMEYKLTYKAQTYSDSTGLYTRIDVGDAEHHIITFPEGKLPFVGDSWAQYRIREMAADRQQMNDVKEQATLGSLAGVGDVAVNTATTLALGTALAPATGGLSLAATLPAAATLLGSGISAATNTALEMRTAEREQAVTEQRQKGMAGTGYNTGYGIFYCDNAFYIGAGFVILMPSRFNAADAHERGMMFGYNAGFVGDATITNGYYQGTPYPIGSNFQPMNDEELRRYYELLENGVRIALI